MLRGGLISAGMCAAASLVAGGCSSASPPSLPSLAEITGAVSEAEVVGAPTEVYARVARGAMACWFGTAGPLKAGYVYHAEAEPAGKGGKAEIVIHERDRKAENQRGARAFRVGIAKEGEVTALTIENIKLAEALAKSMERDVRRWGGGAIGCSGNEGGWETKAPPPPELPRKKPHTRTGGAT